MAKTAIDAARFDAYYIEPDRVKQRPKGHPRYDVRTEAPPDEGLVISMMAIGFTTVASIEKDGEDYYIVDGRRRHHAALEANRRLVKLGREPIRMAVVNKRGDEGALFGVQMSSNLNRLDHDPVEQAKLLQRYMAFGHTEEEAGAAAGLNKVETKRLLKLLDCAPQVQKAVSTQKLSVSAAEQLAKLPKYEQSEKLEKVLAEGPTERSSRATVAKVRKAVKNAQGDVNAQVPPSRALLKKALGEAEGDSKVSLEVSDVMRWVVTGQLVEGWFKNWLKEKGLVS